MGVALAGTVATALAVAVGVLWLGLDLLDVHGLKPEKRISSEVLFDLVKLSFAVVAGLGGLVALVVAYRKQRTEENAALRENTKLHDDRFNTAVTKLGDASPAVRLGGVHALAGLADDAPTRQLRQTCIDVLCAYLRLPYDPDPDPGDAPEHAQAHQTFRSLREVRHTIFRLIAAHLRDDATVSWQRHDLDFTGVIFDDAEFHGAKFSGSAVSFRGAKFSGGTAASAARGSPAASSTSPHEVVRQRCRLPRCGVLRRRRRLPRREVLRQRCRLPQRDVLLGDGRSVSAGKLGCAAEVLHRSGRIGGAPVAAVGRGRRVVKPVRRCIPQGFGPAHGRTVIRPPTDRLLALRGYTTFTGLTSKDAQLPQNGSS